MGIGVLLLTVILPTGIGEALFATLVIYENMLPLYSPMVAVLMLEKLTVHVEEKLQTLAAYLP
jgi:hypothetical protein